MGIKLLSPKFHMTCYALEGESDQPETFRDCWRPNDKLVESYWVFFYE